MGWGRGKPIGSARIQSAIGPLQSFASAFATALIAVEDVLRSRLIHAPADVFVHRTHSHDKKEVADTDSDQKCYSYSERFAPS